MLTPMLDPGQTAATSLDIVVPQGVVVTVAAYAAVPLPHGTRLSVRIKTPLAAQEVAELVPGNAAHALTAPGTYVVDRPSLAHLGVNVGVGITQ